ncbi:MAG: NADAR family protein [Nitrospirae bacterium]|nr:NADAR family protein [Nitrospirota bacterium]
MAEERVKQFRGEYSFLSNFYASEIAYEGLIYPSVENAFQAAKVLDNTKRVEFTTVKAGSAKKLGRKVLLRSDWNTARIIIMKELLIIKFSQEPLRSMLLSTGNAILEEGNTWNDTFWGISLKTGRGSNMLGRLLMEVRGELEKQ